MEKKTAMWITVNRACNIRCKWCYAKDTNYCSNDQMVIDDAKKIVEFASEMNIGRIIIIGGEPTIYPSILELVKYIKGKGIRSTIVSNGIVFSDAALLQQYLDAGIDDFSISIKANSRKEYIETTGVDCYDRLVTAIRNLRDKNAQFSVSQVLTRENISTFYQGIEEFKKAGAENFSFSFCYNFNCSNNINEDFIANNNPYILAELFKRHYPMIEKSLNGCKYSFSQGLPLCVWDYDFIRDLAEKRVVNSICQLLSGGGILFDTDLSLIPCNAMFQLKYGKFGADFFDKQSFYSLLEKREVKDMFALLKGIPDLQCLRCDKAQYCGGGCVTNWTNYSFDELQTTLKNEYILWLSNNGEV